MKSEIKVIANLPIKGMDVIKRCYSGGISPSLTTMQGGQREPKVVVHKIATNKHLKDNKRKLSPEVVLCLLTKN